MLEIGVADVQVDSAMTLENRTSHNTDMKSVGKGQEFASQSNRNLDAENECHGDSTIKDTAPCKTATIIKQSHMPVELMPTLLPAQVPRFPIYTLENGLKSTVENLAINGLAYHDNFITSKDRDEILQIVYRNNWSCAIHRRQQFYGLVYFHTSHDLQAIQPKVNNVNNDLRQFDWLIEKLLNIGVFKSWPDQVLVNEYVGKMGIASHLDVDTAFGDTIVTLSLINHCWLTLTSSNTEAKVLMEPNSLLIMQKDARFVYKHGITKCGWVVLGNDIGVKRSSEWKRISLTFRHLLDSRKKVEKDTSGWV